MYLKIYIIYIYYRMKSIINIVNFDLPKEIRTIIHRYAKKKDRTQRTEHAKIINGLRFIRSAGNLFCISKTGEAKILYPKFNRMLVLRSISA
jgi:hypothetical protein